MKLTVKQAGTVVFGMALASCGGGGSCCQQPAVITQVPTKPQTTGAKVGCECTLTTSDEVQSIGHFPATISQDLEICLPVNFEGREEDFCMTSFGPWLRIAAEQIALTVGATSGLPADCVNAAACAG